MGFLCFFQILKKLAFFLRFGGPFLGICFLSGAAFFNLYGVFLFFGGFSIFFLHILKIWCFFFNFPGVLLLAIYVFLFLFLVYFSIFLCGVLNTFEGEDGAAI